jgi:hypothetical protein
MTVWVSPICVSKAVRIFEFDAKMTSAMGYSCE